MQNIWLIRHGESAGNVDKTVYKTMGDHEVPLTERGHEQANRAATALLSFVQRGTAQQKVEGGRPKLRVWSSPYRRARETTNHITGLLRAMDFIHLMDSPDNKPHPHMPDWHRESIRLAEQQFGLLNGIADEKVEDHYPDVHLDYERSGKFYARPPGGESRFDVAVRVHQQFGTFHRDAERHGVDNIVVVCHGTTLRCFVMEWLHLPVEWIEAEPNPKNCAIRHISSNPSGGYTDHGYVWEGE